MSSAAGCPRGVNVVGVGGTTRDSSSNNNMLLSHCTALRIRQATASLQWEASDQNTILDALSHYPGIALNSLRATPTTHQASITIR